MTTRYHSKLHEVETLVREGITTMLTGEKGSGKTTLARQVADKLELNFYSMSMTRQTTLSHLIGFKNVEGRYIPTQLREAVEFGGLMLLDEIDGSDPNVLLTLNTLENGYMSFPDGIVDCHDDFRLMATANPQDQHSHYTGRAKLDGATLDRFDIVHVDRDDELEHSLVSFPTVQRMNILRAVLKENNVPTIVSMRDSIRYEQRSRLNLLDGFVERIVGDSQHILKHYQERVELLPKHTDQSECTSLSDLKDLMKARKSGA